MNNLVPPSGFDGITRRAEFARLVGEAERQHLPPQSGVRRTTRGTQLLPRIPDLVLDAGGGQGYDGPFRAWKWNDGLGADYCVVDQGYIFVGGANSNVYTNGTETGAIGASWDWPSSANPVQTGDGPGGAYAGIYVSGESGVTDGDALVVMTMQVDPYSGWFTKDAPYYPDLTAIDAADYATLNQQTEVLDVIIARVTLASGLITRIRQDQRSNLYLTSFHEYSPDQGYDDLWYVGLSHGNIAFDPTNTAVWALERTVSTNDAATERNGG